MVARCRQLGAGQTLNGAPTEAGRTILQNVVGSLPQVQALLTYLPAAQQPLGRNVSFSYGGNTYSVPIGSLTGSANMTRNNNQASGRIDYQLGTSNIGGHYLWTDQETRASWA